MEGSGTCASRVTGTVGTGTQPSQRQILCNIQKAPRVNRTVIGVVDKHAVSNRDNQFRPIRLVRDVKDDALKVLILLRDLLRRPDDLRLHRDCLTKSDATMRRRRDLKGAAPQNKPGTKGSCRLAVPWKSG